MTCVVRIPGSPHLELSVEPGAIVPMINVPTWWPVEGKGADKMWPASSLSLLPLLSCLALSVAMLVCHACLSWWALSPWIHETQTPFFLKLLLSIVFCYSNRKITNYYSLRYFWPPWKEDKCLCCTSCVPHNPQSLGQTPGWFFGRKSPPTLGTLGLLQS